MCMCPFDMISPLYTVLCRYSIIGEALMVTVASLLPYFDQYDSSTYIVISDCTTMSPLYIVDDLIFSNKIITQEQK